jgi:hypothetical protein
MKKMKLFFLGICAAMASTAMGQVTLTANDATDKAAGWTLSLQTPKEIAGWQMKIALPEGVTISSKELKVGDATFTEYDGVKLPARYGAKYKAVGTPTADGVFLFFIPVAAEYTADDFKIDGQEGEACTITLKAANYETAAAVAITNIVAADKDGNSTDLSGADQNFAVNHPKGDATCDFKVDLNDILRVISDKKSGQYVATSDINGDSKLDLNDILAVIKCKKD